MSPEAAIEVFMIMGMIVALLIYILHATAGVADFWTVENLLTNSNGQVDYHNAKYWNKRVQGMALSDKRPEAGDIVINVNGSQEPAQLLYRDSTHVRVRLSGGRGQRTWNARNVKVVA